MALALQGADLSYRHSTTYFPHTKEADSIDSLSDYTHYQLTTTPLFFKEKATFCCTDFQVLTVCDVNTSYRYLASIIVEWAGRTFPFSCHLLPQG